MNTKKLFPLPYERQHSSQHGEDGIIETMISYLNCQNKIAIEIGAGDGRQNMTRNLVENHNYIAHGYDINYQKFFHNNYHHYRQFIELDHLEILVDTWPRLDPDFFSLDIDSFDFWIMKSLLKNNYFRPKIICAEYLCYYGPERIISVKKDLESFPIYQCGCSLNLYKQLMNSVGYNFFTCDSSGVNAFFYDPLQVKKSIEDLQVYEWAFFTKYKKYINQDFNVNKFETDTNILLG